MRAIRRQATASLFILTAAGGAPHAAPWDGPLCDPKVCESAAREESRYSGKALTTTYKPFLGRLGPTFHDWFAYKFDAYQRAFVRANGRVVDPENDHVTHSEGQGYGMLLALVAGDRAAFESIWRFTRTRMRRDDGLVSWRWHPDRHPNVSDPNNATDGDLLIATALALAAMRWDVEAHARQAERLARRIREELVVRHGGFALLLPGAFGFERRTVPASLAAALGIAPDRSPVFNLSYWIFFAFPVLDRIDPHPAWRALEASGLALVASAEDGPTDWSVLEEGAVVPAPGWPRIFSYNAVRIPLYLLMSGYRIPSLSEHLLAAWGPPDAHVPVTFRHGDRHRLDSLAASGYRLIHGLVHCTHTGAPIDMALLREGPDTYYSTSLFLLAVTVLYTHHPECFPPLGGNWP